MYEFKWTLDTALDQSPTHVGVEVQVTSSPPCPSGDQAFVGPDHAHVLRVRREVAERYRHAKKKMRKRG